ncbi:mitochondrial inner membrane organizing system protein NCU06495 [Cercophora newfieldiana]|uniref:MICOS complex subunit MIC10 n=1 Tax=Cercophora newfieldiana TaxID=92897 RepID=A0AA39Y6T9_9PEZI|nr:mitochondrial inner membrane organizing system protein NCU06495 [Cercophora newfieldiana]
MKRFVAPIRVDMAVAVLDRTTKADNPPQWDFCLSNALIKSTLGLGFGVVFSVLLFKRRAWPAFVGVGFGAGRAYEECNSSLKLAAREIKKQA